LFNFLFLSLGKTKLANHQFVQPVIHYCIRLYYRYA